MKFVTLLLTGLMFTLSQPAAANQTSDTDIFSSCDPEAIHIALTMSPALATTPVPYIDFKKGEYLTNFKTNPSSLLMDKIRHLKNIRSDRDAENYRPEHSAALIDIINCERSLKVLTNFVKYNRLLTKQEQIKSNINVFKTAIEVSEFTQSVMHLSSTWTLPDGTSQGDVQRTLIRSKQLKAQSEDELRDAQAETDKLRRVITAVK